MTETIRNYHEAVAFLESLSNLSRTFPSRGKVRDLSVPGRRSPKTAKESLKKVQAFLKFIGNPEKKLKIIHITGTSGKGSAAAMLHEILLANGERAGSYTSPHTTTFCERIRVGDKYISERELVELVNFLKKKMDGFIMDSRHSSAIRGIRIASLNFFESSFIIALLYFQKMKCEYAVIEAGMGGRYDATNAIQKPIYTIITNIGPDHLDIIGPTLKDVAYEKAGIIKQGVPVLTGETDKRWVKIFCREIKTKNFYHYDRERKRGGKQSQILRDCRVASLLATTLRNVDYKDLKNIETDLDGTEFEYKNEKYKLKLSGKHQAENAALAIECAGDLKVPQAAIKRGLAGAFYPARLEIISKNPLIIIDGAHNSDKLQATLQFIRKFKVQSSKFKSYLIIAAAKNKRIKKIIPALKSYFDTVVATRFSNPFRKVLDRGDWQRRFANKKILYYHYPHDALRAVLTKLRKDDLLLITGSIFLAGELRGYWYPEKEIIKNRKSK